MDAVLLYPFAEFWWVYAAFTIAVLVVLFIDLGVFHRTAHVVSYRESLGWSAVWVATALLFNFGLYQHAAQTFGPVVGQEVGLEFLTGYLIEKALAVDNVFVFVLVFQRRLRWQVPGGVVAGSDCVYFCSAQSWARSCVGPTPTDSRPGRLTSYTSPVTGSLQVVTLAL